MAQGEYVSPFGKPDGLEKRMLMWARQLGQDKRYPWIGTGIIADLELASKMLGGDGVTEAKPAEHPVFTSTPAPVEGDEFADFHAAKAAQEYDL